MTQFNVDDDVRMTDGMQMVIISINYLYSMYSMVVVVVMDVIWNTIHVCMYLYLYLLITYYSIKDSDFLSKDVCKKSNYRNR